MRSVAAQFAGQAQDAIEIGAGRLSLSLALGAFALQAAQGFARQILDENRVFLVRLVAGRRRLEIKTDGARFFILKLQPTLGFVLESWS